jgi:hypothetical protein
MWTVFEKLNRQFSNFLILLGDLWQIMMIYRTLKKIHDKNGGGRCEIFV